MRYLSIEILRTVSIVLMVQVHFTENLSGKEIWIPTGFAAPMFTFLSGVSYRLWLNGQMARGRQDSEISKVTLRRGMFLFGVGILFNVLVWLPEDTFNWDILTFIGSAVMFLNVVRKMPAPIPPLVCSLVFVASPLLRSVSEYPAYWVNGYFECDFTLYQVALGFFVNGFFPIFPWIIYPVAGYWVASQLFPQSHRSAGALNRLTGLGLCLLAAFAGAHFLAAYGPTGLQEVWLEGPTMFPASAQYVLGTLGMALTCFTCLHRWLDALPPSAAKPQVSNDNPIRRVATTFSKHSFTVYLLHHAVHIWPLWLYGLAVGEDPTEFWQIAMPVWVSLPLAYLFLVVCYFLLRWMDRTGIPGIETIMRWICD